MRSSDPHRIELDGAGLVDVETGRLEPPVELLSWDRPEVVEAWSGGSAWPGGYLAWRWGGQRLVEPGPGLLEGFVGLGSATNQEIRDFALAWGVLELCEHGLPRSHRPDPWPAGSGPRGCRPIGWRDDAEGFQYGMFVEPTPVWRRLAARMRAALLVAAAVREGEPIPADQWRLLAQAGHRYSAAPNPDPNAALVGVWAVVNDWQHYGRVGTICYSVDYAGAGPLTELVAAISGAGLAGGLALQLLAKLTGTDPFAFCSACGKLYSPERKPRRGERRYCDPCKAEGKTLRDAQRDRSDRNRAGIASQRERRRQVGATDSSDRNADRRNGSSRRDGADKTARIPGRNGTIWTGQKPTDGEDRDL